MCNITEHCYCVLSSTFLYWLLSYSNYIENFTLLAESLTYAMPIVSRSYFSMINLYSIGPTVVKSVDVETIRHRRNSDTESNDNTSRSVIFEEWEELEAISALVLL